MATKHGGHAGRAHRAHHHPHHPHHSQRGRDGGHRPATGHGGQHAGAHGHHHGEHHGHGQHPHHEQLGRKTMSGCRTEQLTPTLNEAGVAHLSKVVASLDSIPAVMKQLTATTLEQPPRSSAAKHRMATHDAVGETNKSGVDLNLQPNHPDLLLRGLPSAVPHTRHSYNYLGEAHIRPGESYIDARDGSNTDAMSKFQMQANRVIQSFHNGVRSDTEWALRAKAREQAVQRPEASHGGGHAQSLARMHETGKVDLFGEMGSPIKTDGRESSDADDPEIARAKQVLDPQLVKKIARIGDPNALSLERALQEQQSPARQANSRAATHQQSQANRKPVHRGDSSTSSQKYTVIPRTARVEKRLLDNMQGRVQTFQHIVKKRDTAAAGTVDRAQFAQALRDMDIDMPEEDVDALFKRHRARETAHEGYSKSVNTSLNAHTTAGTDSLDYNRLFHSMESRAHSIADNKHTEPEARAADAIERRVARKLLHGLSDPTAAGGGTSQLRRVFQLFEDASTAQRRGRARRRAAEQKRRSRSAPRMRSASIGATPRMPTTPLDSAFGMPNVGSSFGPLSAFVADDHAVSLRGAKQKRGPVTSALTSMQLKQALELSGVSLNDHEMTTLTKMADANHDGLISLDEFTGMLHRYSREARTEHEDVVHDTLNSNPRYTATFQSNRALWDYEHPEYDVHASSSGKDRLISARLHRQLQQEHDKIREVFVKQGDKNGTISARELCMGLNMLGVRITDDDFHRRIMTKFPEHRVQPSEDGDDVRVSYPDLCTVLSVRDVTDTTPYELSRGKFSIDPRPQEAPGGIFAPNNFAAAANQTYATSMFDTDTEVGLNDRHVTQLSRHKQAERQRRLSQYTNETQLWGWTKEQMSEPVSLALYMTHLGGGIASSDDLDAATESNMNRVRRSMRRQSLGGGASMAKAAAAARKGVASANSASWRSRDLSTSASSALAGRYLRKPNESTLQISIPAGGGAADGSTTVVGASSRTGRESGRNSSNSTRSRSAPPRSRSRGGTTGSPWTPSSLRDMVESQGLLTPIHAQQPNSSGKQQQIGLASFPRSAGPVKPVAKQPAQRAAGQQTAGEGPAESGRTMKGTMQPGAASTSGRALSVEPRRHLSKRHHLTTTRQPPPFATTPAN